MKVVWMWGLTRFPNGWILGKMLRNDCRHLALHTEWCVVTVCKSLSEIKLSFQSLKCSELELWWKGCERVALSTLFSVVVVLRWVIAAGATKWIGTGADEFFYSKTFYQFLSRIREMLEDRREFEKSHIDVFIALGKVSRMSTNQCCADSFHCRSSSTISDFSYTFSGFSLHFEVKLRCEWAFKINEFVDFKSHADASKMDEIIVQQFWLLKLLTEITHPVLLCCQLLLHCLPYRARSWMAQLSRKSAFFTAKQIGCIIQGIFIVHKTLFPTYSSIQLISESTARSVGCAVCRVAVSRRSWLIRTRVKTERENERAFDTRERAFMIRWESFLIANADVGRIKSDSDGFTRRFALESVGWSRICQRVAFEIICTK